ncbi:MAG: hypothetical protein LAO79_10935 [Acidobacteriia bacterium]|nr:hypothetical protein [Terriglobia bacterium]
MQNRKTWLFLAVMGASALRAQSTPEIREILDRLQKLEEANRALNEEVRSLKDQLAAARGAPAETTQEEMAVQKARVEEMAQSKVESSQKLPLRITGMALFNTYVNGGFNANTDNALIASLARADATGGATVRQSIVGLEFESPKNVLGGKVTGSIYADFFGGSPASLNHTVRLRTATVSLDWSQTSLTFGQTKPIISPRDPNSLAQVGISPLTDSGNLWLWQPQIRVEERFHFGTNAGLRAQVGVLQMREIGVEATGYNFYAPAPAGVAPSPEHAQPAVEGRFELWKQWGENTRIEIAPGFHENASNVDRSDVSSKLFSIDWLIKPVRFVELTGFFYNGQNAAGLGALPQGFTPGYYDRYKAVHTTGGWAQLRFPITERLAFDLFGGRQDDRDRDLLRGYIGLNQAYYANVMYRLAPNVLVSLEAGQLRTSFLGIGNRLNNHYDLAVAYLF